MPIRRKPLTFFAPQRLKPDDVGEEMRNLLPGREASLSAGDLEELDAAIRGAFFEVRPV